ncbi:hypothetical protein OO006_03080 [Prosthecochloris sp. SCSIO W1101]|uniref:hypothetical protein n=1 Tax=Prosthecochloris sp. SCSIO W1101 TaxID=2992242 RepID=UPI00223DED86|nr:hypothetical protein [Prosthecochloris sp. SCSIO W1101]UZJ41995.1 hypothetical protein OO006_03080 [Prosthecochloris sp. SCSIO W1101]
MRSQKAKGKRKSGESLWIPGSRFACPRMTGRGEVMLEDDWEKGVMLNVKRHPIPP